MKRFIRLALWLLCIVCIPAHASYTFIASHAVNIAASGGTLVFAGDFTVQAGDLMIAVDGNLEGGATSLSLSDGTSTFTQAATPQAFGGGAAQIAMHYLLSSVATGSVTYTLTYGAARTYRSMVIFQFRPSAPVTFGSATSASGTSTAISSGNLPVSGSDILAIAAAFSFNTANMAALSPLINGVAADGQANNSYTLAWYRAAAAGFTGAATATFGSSDDWGALLGYFRIGASGSDSTPDSFTFTDQSGVALSSTITSAAITVAGIDTGSTITVSGGTYDINASGSFTGSSGTVNNGDTVRARHTSSASNSTATNTVVTIGGVSDTFTSTTLSGGGSKLLIFRRRH